MKTISQLLIFWYKKFLSPFIGNNCIYTPTCSMYMLDAIKEYGFIRGVIMGLGRLLRCNHFSKGGFDPVKPNLRGKAKWVL